MSSKLKQLVIIGGGFAGLRALYRVQDYEYHFEITLIDKNDYSLEKPALPEVAIEGKSEDSVKNLLPPIARESKAAFVYGEVEKIDKDSNLVLLKDGTKIYYDYLVIASGAIKNYDAIKGYREFGYSVCDDAEAKRLYERLKSFEGGKVVTGAAKSEFSQSGKAPILKAPCEGPIGEVMFMIKHKFKDRVDVDVFSPSEIFFEDVGDKSRGKVAKIMQEQGIRLHTNKTLKEITKDRVIFEDGTELESDLAIVIPPYKAPTFIADAGLGDDKGWLDVNENMQSVVAKNIYGCGDITNLAQPKLGHIAINQADVAISHILKEEGLSDEVVKFNPEVFCIMNMGGFDAVLIYSDVLYNKGHDLAWHSKLAKAMKTGFDSEYHYTHGHMPPDSIVEILEDILQKFSK